MEKSDALPSDFIPKLLNVVKDYNMFRDGDYFKNKKYENLKTFNDAWNEYNEVKSIAHK